MCDRVGLQEFEDRVKRHEKGDQVTKGHVPSVQNPAGAVRALCPPLLIFGQIISSTTTTAAMSHSPSASISNNSESANKKRKAPASSADIMAAATPIDGGSQHQPSASATHIPKRGARACTSCRKGKNRCEGEVRVLCSRRATRSVD